MRLLLDTSVLLPVLRGDHAGLHRSLVDVLADAGTKPVVSVASLWEIAIKHRLGKLPLKLPLDELPWACASAGAELLPLTPEHALAEAEPVPATRDPLDRLLLAVCAVEDMRLLTTDRALAVHPLAWRAGG